MKQDAPVEVSLEEGRPIITPVEETAYSLEDLLAQVTDENIHREFNTGPAGEKENW
jgi:antitoxin MazE